MLTHSSISNIPEPSFFFNFFVKPIISGLKAIGFPAVLRVSRLPENVLAYELGVYTIFLSVYARPNGSL